MIKHIVLFKLAESAEGNTKIENAQIIKRRLEELKAIIPEIVNIEVQINHEGASTDNYDIILDSEFESLEDLNVYVQHEAHQRVGEFIVKVRTARAAIDYEI